MVMTAPTNAAIGNEVINKWYLLNTAGGILSSGTLAEAASIYTFGFGNSTNTQFACCTLENDYTHVWRCYGAGSGEMALYEIVGGVLTQTGSLYSPNGLALWEFTYPSIYVKYGVAWAVSGNSISVFTRLRRITPSLVSLSTIVQSECLASGLLSAGDIDVTELTDEVRGYRIGQRGALRTNVEQLGAAYPFDAIQSGYKIKFKRRGSSSVATVLQADLGVEGDAEITLGREMDTLLPRKLMLRYLEVEKEYDTGEQVAQRSAQ